jgi:hypothetical protein
MPLDEGEGGAYLREGCDARRLLMIVKLQSSTTRRHTASASQLHRRHGTVGVGGFRAVAAAPVGSHP